MATSAETARNTRAVASHRSIRRISPGLIGALCLHRNRCRSARNGNGVRPDKSLLSPRILLRIVQESKRRAPPTFFNVFPQLHVLAQNSSPIHFAPAGVTEVMFFCRDCCLELASGCHVSSRGFLPGRNLRFRLRASGSFAVRSEERRVGKECRSRWSPEQLKEKQRRGCS